MTVRSKAGRRITFCRRADNPVDKIGRAGSVRPLCYGEVPRFVRGQSMRQGRPASGAQKELFWRSASRMVIGRGGAFVEAARVPGIAKSKTVEVQMMAELMTESAQKRSE